MSENEQEKVAEIHQWFCHLHLLANMGDSVNKALKEYEKIITDGTGKLGRSQLPTFSSWSDKDSAAVRCIRTVCSALVSGGNASSGCPEDFKTYLFSKGKTCRLKDLNILDSILYLKMPVLWEILSVATIGKIITTPFLRLIDSKTVATHILDLNQHFLQLQINLKQWSKDPSDLISGETVLFPEVPPCKDDIFDALPEGCHGTDNETIREESLTVPKHNRTSEKNFADFKQIRHFKPNSSIEHIEATLMWVNNKTVEWLDLMDPEIKNAKITLAMKRAPEFISKWHERVENGLRLRLNVEQYEYMPGPHDAAGVKILLHDSFEEPRIKNLPSPHGQCSSKDLRYYNIYSQEGCKMDCLCRTAELICGCRHIYMPYKNGYPSVCTIKQYDSCLKQLMDEFTSFYEENCHCPVPCYYNSYQSDISYASTSVYAANKFLAKNITQNLRENLKLASDVTSRMDEDTLEDFLQLYESFNATLSTMKDNIMNVILKMIMDIKLQVLNTFNQLQSACVWKEWLYRYQDYIVQKNFMRPRDAYDDRFLHELTVSYNELILTVEFNIRTLNSSAFINDTVREFLYMQTISLLKNRQYIIKRSLENFNTLIAAYRSGIQIFDYTFENVPFSHNYYAVPKQLLLNSLSQNNYSMEFIEQFEISLNESYNLLTFIKGLTEIAYENRSLTREQMFNGKDEFRRNMRDVGHGKSIVNYEIIDRPHRILAERKSEFNQNCFAANITMHSIDETLQSLTTTIHAANITIFIPFEFISNEIKKYFSNTTSSKFDIASKLISGDIWIAEITGLKNKGGGSQKLQVNVVYFVTDLDLGEINKEMEERKNKIESLESSFTALRKDIEGKKKKEILSFKIHASRCDGEFQTVPISRPSKPSVILMGTSNTESIDPRISPDYSVHKVTAYTLDETEK
ncbi:unnamed protein product [Mytilus coruscus]|uniref:Uncharacterized protein n=1 Tax=Mytilus coruscus TaxID=42192 RepID=A0A6J8DT38_MYTCO|nr:unnamed protein product [Mytilus coruscus]